MRLAVFGSNGALGRAIREACVVRSWFAISITRNVFSPDDRGSVLACVSGCEPDAVINCLGLVPSAEAAALDVILVNSVFPHLLAEVCVEVGVRVVHVSTDHVFSGRSAYKYDVRSVPDPKDYYGKTRALGEVAAPNVANIRTTFVGDGMLNWLRNNNGKEVDGRVNSKWSGSTVEAVANAILDVAADPTVCGLHHLATDVSISKYDVITQLISTMKLEAQVRPVMQPIINRALVPTISLLSLEEALCLELVR